MEPGYIYVLINASMEGLVKIGKTTRESKTRAAELSSATGVPTPFIVAYEEYFSDVTAAEAYVHTLLEERGHRVSGDREFFNADLKDVILAIQSAKVSLDTDKNEAESPITIDEAGDKDTNSLIDTLFKGAMDAQHGWNNCIQDQDKAIRLYKQAIKLGDGSCCHSLGKMYRTNYEASKQETSIYTLDNKEALKYFKIGADRGFISCYSEMAEIYEEHSEFKNALTCWNIYFDNEDDALLDEVLRYIHLAWYQGVEIRHPAQLIDNLRRERKREHLPYRINITNLMDAIETHDKQSLEIIFASDWWLNNLDTYFHISSHWRRYSCDPYDVRGIIESKPSKWEETYDKGVKWLADNKEELNVERKQIQSTGCLVIVGGLILISYGVSAMFNYAVHL